MAKPDVLVVWPNRPKQMAMLEEAYNLHHLYNAGDPDALVAEVGPKVRGIATTGEQGASRELIERCPNLEIVACYGVGIDAIDQAACAERNIPITNTPDVLTEDVADMGLALMLAILRRIPQGDRWVREGHWKKDATPLTACARGRVVGVLGLGRIGKAFAKRAEVLGMKVVYHGRNKQNRVPYQFFPDLRTMAHDVDVLVLTCPGGAATRGLVTADVLAGLGPEGYLVNVARGSVVDEAALVDALVGKGIAGAALDVFADEPNVPEALLGLDNVVLQPHAASATVETRHAMAQLVVDNLAAHFAGRPLLTQVRPS
jgi:lactate dehydrogenase-like 2-hydroxyacid dehydrogenase